MISINTNVATPIVQNSLKTSTNKLNTAIERLVTGYKINSAKDNAANYSITTNMSTKIGAYVVAEDNCSMGIDMLTTASESLDLINDRLVRLRALAEQAANGTYGEESLKAINTEANAIIDEIERTYANAEYNGIKLFEATGAGENDFAADPSLLLMNSVTQLSESEARAQGYSIIKTAADLQNMNSNGKYILMNDIDLSEYSWTSISSFGGELNGNGHAIKNLTAESGLFKNFWGSVKNLVVLDADISNSDSWGEAGIIAGYSGGEIDNCSVTGSVRAYNAGGLVGSSCVSTITNCYADVDVVGQNAASGIASTQTLVPETIQNCYAKGTVTATDPNACVSGIFGGRNDGVCGDIENCYSECVVSGNSPYVGNIFGSINSWYWNDFSSSNVYYKDDPLNPSEYSTCGASSPMQLDYAGVTDAELVELVKNGTLPASFAKYIVQESNITLQVGINCDSNSQISFSNAFSLSGLDSLRGIGVDGEDYFSVIDDLTSQVAAKQTELGAKQNRLESVLEEISIKYENLVSSRSTLRDADVAEVSSEYIRQQILQQVSATLLSAANQTPALALQLL